MSIVRKTIDIDALVDILFETTNVLKIYSSKEELKHDISLIRRYMFLVVMNENVRAIYIKKRNLLYV